MSWSASSPLAAAVTSCPSSFRTDVTRRRMAGSSSTTRMLALPFAIGGYLLRECDLEGRPLPTGTGNSDRPAVRLDDLLTDRQAEPGPLGPRRVEWLEDPGQIRLGDPGPCVLDGDFDRVC